MSILLAVLLVFLVCKWFGSSRQPSAFGCLWAGFKIAVLLISLKLFAIILVVSAYVTIGRILYNR